MTENFTNKPASNIDEAEIARFEAMAPIWWDRQGDYKALHDINVLRLNYINERAALTGKSVLDVGCGGGILSEAMASRGAMVTGIDIGEAALGVARLHLKESGLEVVYQQATVLSNLRKSIRTNLMWSPAWSSWNMFPNRPR